jgi:hypothetical protein
LRDDVIMFRGRVAAIGLPEKPDDLISRIRLVDRRSSQCLGHSDVNIIMKDVKRQSRENAQRPLSQLLWSISRENDAACRIGYNVRVFVG